MSLIKCVYAVVKRKSSVRATVRNHLLPCAQTQASSLASPFTALFTTLRTRWSISAAALPRPVLPFGRLVPANHSPTALIKLIEVRAVGRPRVGSNEFRSLTTKQLHDEPMHYPAERCKLSSAMLRLAGSNRQYYRAVECRVTRIRQLAMTSRFLAATELRARSIILRIRGGNSEDLFVCEEVSK